MAGMVNDVREALMFVLVLRGVPGDLLVRTVHDGQAGRCCFLKSGSRPGSW